MNHNVSKFLNLSFVPKNHLLNSMSGAVLPELRRGLKMNYMDHVEDKLLENKCIALLHLAMAHFVSILKVQILTL